MIGLLDELAIMHFHLWLLRAIFITCISLFAPFASSDDDSDAAYVENMRRMGMYDARFQETLSASNISMRDISAMESANSKATTASEQPTPTPVGSASPQVIEALQTMIDASNLSKQQRAELILYLQRDY